MYVFLFFHVFVCLYAYWFFPFPLEFVCVDDVFSMNDLPFL